MRTPDYVIYYVNFHPLLFCLLVEECVHFVLQQNMNKAIYSFVHFAIHKSGVVFKVGELNLTSTRAEIFMKVSMKCWFGCSVFQ